MFCILVIWPVLMGMTGLTSYVAVVYSTPINVLSNFSYMSALIVTCVNIAGSKFVTKTTELEGWTARTQIKASIYHFAPMHVHLLCNLPIYPLCDLDVNHSFCPASEGPMSIEAMPSQC